MNKAVTNVGRAIFAYWGIVAFFGILLVGRFARLNFGAGMIWMAIMMISMIVSMMMVFVQSKTEHMDHVRFFGGAWAAVCALGALAIYATVPVTYYSQMFSNEHLLGFVAGLGFTAAFCFGNVKVLRPPTREEIRAMKEEWRNEYDPTRVDRGMNDRIFSRPNSSYPDYDPEETMVIGIVSAETPALKHRKKAQHQTH